MTATEIFNNHLQALREFKISPIHEPTERTYSSIEHIRLSLIDGDVIPALMRECVFKSTIGAEVPILIFALGIIPKNYIPAIERKFRQSLAQIKITE